ncbi:MAG: tetratricopeptide repeat protein [FCB group bacterium]|nr:tetratricopeptide repeat protein [FCB group bacterium]
MKRIIIMTILLTLSVLFAKTDMRREPLFKQGISAYVNEDYAKAQMVFHQLERDGASWELYYNLGNAYYRDGKLGHAIQYWEKAKMLAPSQKDIHHNLSLAQQELIDKVVLPDMFPLFRWYRNMQEYLPVQLPVMIGGILLIFLTLTIGYARINMRRTGTFSRNGVISLSVILVSLILVLNLVAFDTEMKRQKEIYAVILDRTVNILSAPVQESPVLFVLHEGSKVRINKQIEDEWANISYFDDKIGWINMKSLGKIQP